MILTHGKSASDWSTDLIGRQFIGFPRTMEIDNDEQLFYAQVEFEKRMSRNFLPNLPVDGQPASIKNCDGIITVPSMPRKKVKAVEVKQSLPKKLAYFDHDYDHRKQERSLQQRSLRSMGPEDMRKHSSVPHWG